MNPPDHVRNSLFRLTLHTQIDIDAAPAKVWEILTNFDDYARWNPAIPFAEGQASCGSRLHVAIQWPGLQRGNYVLRVTAAHAPRELRWLGHFVVKGLMDGDHRFVIETKGNKGVRVIQMEQFSGLLVPFFAPWLRRNVLEGFRQLNGALKSRAES